MEDCWLESNVYRVKADSFSGISHSKTLLVKQDGTPLPNFVCWTLCSSFLMAIGAKS